MRLPWGSRLVAAYVCPAGVCAIECVRTGRGVEIRRTLDDLAPVDSPYRAGERLVQMLRGADISRARVVIALRGFGLAHHVLQLPPAPDALLTPVVEREIRRLEPQLAQGLVDWTPLAALDDATDAPAQRWVLAAGIPQDVVAGLEQRLRDGGHELTHVTPLAAAMERLLREFGAAEASSALVAPLPDGAFLGFALGGSLRLVVEPPLPHDVEHQLPALGEEIELGVMFVRQQFRGASIDRLMLVGNEAGAEAESHLTDRFRIPTTRLSSQDLSAGALVALGAVLDAQSARPLALGGSVRRRVREKTTAALSTAATAAVILLVVIAGWTAFETFRVRQASVALVAARARLQQDSFMLRPVRSTADQRRVVRQAADAMRLVRDDRARLQQVLAGVAAVVRDPAQLDSIRMVRDQTGWLASVGGTVTGATNARAVQALHDVYRGLPGRLPVDSLHLDELSYADSLPDDAFATVRFRLTFRSGADRR